MAVYTQLSPQALERYVRAFRVGALLDARGVAAGTINTIYDVKTSQGRYILRILEDRAVSDARFEEALLARLHERELPVPTMVGAGRRGGIVSISPRQHLSLFHYMKGRELAVFEVQASHALQVGAFLASMHVAGRGLRRRRRNRFGPERMRRLLEHCVARTHEVDAQRDLRLLAEEIEPFDWAEELPVGIVHGDLFVDNVRFVGGRLAGVLDFEMASTGALAYDLAVALVDWGFLQDELRVDRAHAIVCGYERVRPLKASEREGLYGLCRFAAARFALTRFYDFEVRRRPEAVRRYKDYRHFVARLAALRRLGREGFEADILRARSCTVSHV